MKVALVISQLNVMGGTHKQMLRLAQYLESRGDEISIYTFTYERNRGYPDFERFKIISFPTIKPRWLHALLKRLFAALWLARRVGNEVDIVNIHDLGCEAFMVWHRIFGRKIPTIWQLNDVSHVFRVGSSAGHPERWHFPARRLAYKLAAQLPAAITVNVRKNQERVSGIYRRSALLYHCGVDIENDIFYAPNTPWRRKLRLVSTGIFYRYRNYETILDVQFLLRDRFGIDTELTIIGTTKFDTKYANLIRSEAVRQNLVVSIVGEVSKEKMIEIYRASDLFFFLNLDQSWGLAIFEAMNWCLPVVVSRSVGATEILENEVNSIIVDPQDALGIATRIAALQSCPDQLEAITQTAFKYVRGMTWENMYCEPVRSLMLQTLTCTK